MIAFASSEGRKIFSEALSAGTMESWFALAEQFHTQSDPAYCGLGSLVVVLNALEIDPKRVWKGSWRWYSEEMLDCCLSLEHIRGSGVTMDQLACLARCNGASARVVRAEESGIETFKDHLHKSVGFTRGSMIIASYSRKVLGQTGDGHFSPLAGYHRERDLALILDVARFKYPPHWVSIKDLWQAMNELDPTTGRSRGFVILERSISTSFCVFPLSLERVASGVRTLVNGLSSAETIANIEDLVDYLNSSFAQDSQTSIHHDLNAFRLDQPQNLSDNENAQAKNSPCSLNTLSSFQEQVISELRSTEAFALVKRALQYSKYNHHFEFITLALLALPDDVRSLLQQDVQRALSCLLSSIPDTVELKTEIASWKNQFTALFALQSAS